ncbi:hypothetical protein FJZ18_01245 [Candidatus Pacearchaeota archaeon]|nr:hypothetical protein [Candidatus Pacearchaeota archaeon]
MRLVSLLLITFLLLGGFFIISNEGLHVQKTDERNVFIEKYSLWIIKLVSQAATITGNALKLDWLP